MDPLFEHNDTDIQALVDRFEEMLKANNHYFFDVEDFEDLIDYYLDSQNLTRCRKALEMAETQHPGASVFMIRKAKYYLLANKPEMALVSLEKLEKIDPTNGDLYLIKGTIYSKQKRFEDAIREFNQAILYASDLEEVYTSIAYEYESAADYAKALEYLKKVLELNPENDSALFELAFCYEMINDPEGGIAYLNAFVDRNPYNKVAWFNLGIAYNNLELFEKAIEAYEFAIAIDVSFASAYFNLANAYGNMGEYMHSIKYYKETFNYEDPQAITYYYIGESYEKLNKFREAIDSYNQAIKAEPDMADAWMGLGVCYDELNESATAVKCMERALDHEDDNAEFWYIYGDLLYKIGNLTGAIRAFERVSALDPAHPDIWIDLSDAYMESKEPGKAFEVIEEGIYQQSANASLYLRLSGMLFRQGKHKPAMSALRKGLQLDYKRYPELFESFPEMEMNTEVQSIMRKLQSK